MALLRTAGGTMGITDGVLWWRPSAPATPLPTTLGTPRAKKVKKAQKVQNLKPGVALLLGAMAGTFVGALSGIQGARSGPIALPVMITTNRHLQSVIMPWEKGFFLWFHPLGYPSAERLGHPRTHAAFATAQQALEHLPEILAPRLQHTMSGTTGTIWIGDAWAKEAPISGLPIPGQLLANGGISFDLSKPFEDRILPALRRNLASVRLVEVMPRTSAFRWGTG